MPNSNDYTVTTSTNGGLDTQHAAGMIVILALGFLYLVRRGFRGASVPGVGGIKLG